MKDITDEILGRNKEYYQGAKRSAALKFIFD